MRTDKNIDQTTKAKQTPGPSYSSHKAVASGARPKTFTGGTSASRGRGPTPRGAVSRGTAPTRQCDRCGGQHRSKDLCPARGKQCNKCSKFNHFARVCRSNKVNVIDDNEYVQIENVNSVIEDGQAFASLLIGPKQKPVKFKIDTGAQVNILPLSVFHKSGVKGPLRSTNVRLTAYNGTALKTKGTISLHCSHSTTGQSKNVQFYVVDTKSQPLLGLKSSLDFGLIKVTFDVESQHSDKITKQTVLREFKDLFTGIGSMPGKCRIHLKPDAIPVIHPPRKTPIALHDKVKQELERMESIGVICKVTEPTEWVNSMVVVEKGQGKLRICLDPTDLNKCIQRPHYHMRTLEDVLPSLSGARYFTKLDARSGYWAISLDHESSLMTCFNTEFGRYMYLRLPFWP